jgi:hypothetical protein
MSLQGKILKVYLNTERYVYYKVKYIIEKGNNISEIYGEVVYDNRKPLYGIDIKDSLKSNKLTISYSSIKGLKVLNNIDEVMLEEL